MMKNVLLTVMGLASVAFISGEEIQAPIVEVIVPAENSFREIGSFRVTSSVLTKLGKTTEVNKGELVLRVFTDGIDIRLSPEGQDDDYIAFQIYRNDSIFDPTGENLSPGVQAFSDQGQVVRHLVVDAKLLTLTKFPTSTSDVEIIYATRYER